MNQAQIAVRAARYWREWGRSAAVKYVLNRGVPIRLLCLALMLETEQRRTS